MKNIFTKFFLPILLMIIGLNIFIFLIVSLYYLDFNISHWSNFIRGLIGIVNLIIFCILTSLYIDQKD